MDEKRPENAAPLLLYADGYFFPHLYHQCSQAMAEKRSHTTVS